MRRNWIFTLTLVLASLTAMVQSNTFAFIDKNGNEISDGVVVNVTDLIEDEDPETGEIIIYMPSGVKVRNMSQESAALKLNINLKRMDNGSGQICFPINCMPLPAVGNYTTNSDLMTAGETRDLQMEWFADEQGICEAEIQIEVMRQNGQFPNFTYVHADFGNTITIRFNYGMPEGIVGDIDGSGMIDVEDVNATINIILKLKNISDYPGNGDMDGNGMIDVEDVNTIINKILNL